jgi:hypothetical protein
MGIEAIVDKFKVLLRYLPGMRGGLRKVAKNLIIAYLRAVFQPATYKTRSRNATCFVTRHSLFSYHHHLVCTSVCDL